MTLLDGVFIFTVGICNLVCTIICVQSVDRALEAVRMTQDSVQMAQDSESRIQDRMEAHAGGRDD